MDYAKEEAKLLTKINDQIEKLDINLSKMGSAENKLAHFADQEKALHDLHSIIRDGNPKKKSKTGSMMKTVPLIKSNAKLTIWLEPFQMSAMMIQKSKVMLNKRKWLVTSNQSSKNSASN